jgi:ABC-2 type transport system permease protein
MRNFFAILKKELHSLFTSPIAYVVLAVFFVVTGYFFFIITSNIISFAMQQMFRAQQFGGSMPPLDVTSMITENYFGILSTILLFMIPMITMSVFAEEKKRGTIELLFTSPITNAQLILGKFGAVVVVLAIMLVPTVLNLILLYDYSDPKPPLAPILSGYVGAFLLGSSLLALGLFISSLTENQIVAAVLTWGVFIVLWVIDSIAGTGSTAANQVLGYLSVLNHYQDFSRGILDSQHVVFYLSAMFLGLFLTSVSLGSVKWRQ